VKTGFDIDKRVVKIGIEGRDKTEVLTNMARMLVEAGYVKESYIDGILKREKIFPTGIPLDGYGIAIPHTDIEHVNSPMVAVATLINPIEFNCMGGGDEDRVAVKIIFMLAMKDGNEQLPMLQSLMHIIQDNKLINDICESTDNELLASLLTAELGKQVNV